MSNIPSFRDPGNSTGFLARRVLLSSALRSPLFDDFDDFDDFDACAPSGVDVPPLSQWRNVSSHPRAVAQVAARE